MKKSLLIAIIAGVVIIVAVVLVVAGVNASKKTAANSTTPSLSTKTVSYKKVEACDVLTTAIATQLAGSDATTTAEPDTATSSVNVSNCSYYSSTTKTSIGLLVRSPLDASAASTNSGQFADPPSDAVTVSGYGTSAYWSPSFGQFNILSTNDTWYILSFGPLTPAQRTQAQAQQFADLIKNDL